MAGTNGHAPTPDVLNRAEFAALLAGVFEPVPFEFAPGKWVEIRPLLVKQSDSFYDGASKGIEKQRSLVAYSVYSDGRPIGEENVADMPFPLFTMLLAVVMRANGMDGAQAPAEGEGEGEAIDPKA